MTGSVQENSGGSSSKIAVFAVFCSKVLFFLRRVGPVNNIFLHIRDVIKHIPSMRRKKNDFSDDFSQNLKIDGISPNHV